MKTIIDKLAIGNIEYVRPKVMLSIQEIKEEVVIDKKFFGKINISSDNKMPIKGIACSDNGRLKIINDQFSGQNITLEYEVDTTYMDTKQDNIINGNISLITNGGEYVVPFSINVVLNYIMSSMGKITSLSEFTNLVQMNYEEALKIFNSKEFVYFLENNEEKIVPMYLGIIKSLDKNLAMEEFLISANQKKKITISIDKNIQVYENIENEYKDTINILRDNWGYLNIGITVDGNFIETKRSRISYEEFIGNKYEFDYIINKSKLYEGINYGKITFSTYDSILVCEIKIINNPKDFILRHKTQNALTNIVNSYIEFRMDRCGLVKWAEETTKNALILEENPLYNNFGMLLKAQVLLSQEKNKEALDILDDFIKYKMLNADKNIELYCYYLYVRSLQKRDENYTKQVLEDIEKMYEKDCASWKLLWMLFYLDEKYEVNKSLKYTLIKGEYSKGCISPIMLYEAANILNEQPNLLRILNKFELLVLKFGAKNNFISDELINKLIEIAVDEKKYSDILFDILTIIYERNKSNNVLVAICTILIRGNKTSNYYFKWYAIGIQQGLRLANIYEYYMYSIDEDYKGILPEMIYMYFVYNSSILGRKQDFLFRNIVENKESIMEIYDNYSNIIENYIIKELQAGNMNMDLSIIYTDIIKSSFSTGSMAKKLPEVVETYELECDNSNNIIKEVVVIHKEILQEDVYRLSKNKAYIKIYTKNPTIIFIDAYGRRYSGSINYTVNKISDMQQYLIYSMEVNKNNEYLTLHFIEKHQYDRNYNVLDLLINVCDKKNIRKKYKSNILKEIINIYNTEEKSDFNDIENKISLDILDCETRNKYFEMLIRNREYEKAYIGINKYGFIGIDLALLLRLTTRYIETIDEAYDENLVLICRYLYDNHQYTDNVLSYLSVNFTGTIKEMVTLWQSDDGFICHNHILEEKILTQLMFSDDKNTDVHEIFRSCYYYGMSKNIKDAFYVFMSKNYIFEQKNDNISYFCEYIEKDLINKQTVPNICKIALGLYGANKNEMTKKEIELYKDIINFLCSRNVMFNAFKDYKRWFEIPFYLEDKTIVDIRNLPGTKIFITYSLSSKSNKKDMITESMQEVFPGIFIKNFVTFYGDNLKYYTTIKSNDEEKINTKSIEINISKEDIYKDSSRYNTLNKILIARDKHDNNKENEISKEFLSQQNLCKNIFRII